MVFPVVSLVAHPPPSPSHPIPRSLQFAVLPAHRLRVSLRCGAAQLPVYQPMDSLVVHPPMRIPITRSRLTSPPAFLTLFWHGQDTLHHRSIGDRDIPLLPSAARPITWPLIPAASTVALRIAL